ncbi:MAG: hypothetical protein HQM15_04105 [Deltaproteobacteria bacterium]|nr:hypothetical protein [Deltaproteobacteria bacterium]
MQSFIFILVFFLNLLLTFSGFAQENSLDTGVPGQIRDLNGVKQLYFESEVRVEWKGKEFSLRDFKNNVIKINLQNGKKTSGMGIDSGLIENDLGGSSKKKAPLAYKNPKLGNTIVSKATTDPLKNTGLKITKNTQEKTAEGGSLNTVEYEDSSKNISYLSKTLKEESSFDSRGVLVWRNIEGEDQGLQFKKTQWEDGSVIREYHNAEGGLSVVSDVQKNTQTFSFLNSEKDLIEEVVCNQGSCEKD